MKVKVALVGVGNCAASFVQGLEYYRWVGDDWTSGWAEHLKSKRGEIPGLLHTKIGGFYPKDVEVVGAFDIAANKVGIDLGKAIYSRPNNTYDMMRSADYFSMGILVQPAPLLDSRQDSYGIDTATANHIELAEYLCEQEANVVVNFLPATSEVATRFWADVAIEAGCAFINCTLTKVARNLEYKERFHKAGLPLFGDDLKGQIGATVLHRWLVKLCQIRGVKIDRTCQFSMAGNTDIYNLLENRPLIKPVQSSLGMGIRDWVAHAGPSDYVSWLLDRKWVYIYIEGKGFGDLPFKIETKLEIWDSPNGAAVLLDLVRAAVVISAGTENKMVSDSFNAYYMKAPPMEMSEIDAYTEIDRFVNNEANDA